MCERAGRGWIGRVYVVDGECSASDRVTDDERELKTNTHTIRRRR